MRITRKRALLVTLLLAAGMTLWLSCGDDKSSEPEPCYTLTTATEGFGTVEVSPDSACYHTGTVVSLTAVPGASWLFDGWSGNIDLGGAENDEAIEVTVGAQNISLTASFIQGYSLTLYVEPDNSGTVDIDPEQQWYASGTIVTLTPTPAVDYEFSSWTIVGDDSIYTDDPFELTIGTSNLIITANFALTYTLEGEPDCGPDYVDEYNGGCNSDPEVFLPIADGERYVGTSGTYLVDGLDQYRDTDWYEYEATQDEILVFTGEAEFPLQLAIIDGTPGCAGFEVIDIDAVDEYDTLTVSAIVGPGTYWMWVGPSVFAGWDCPLNYSCWFEAQPTAASKTTEPEQIDRQMLSNKQQ